MDFAAAQQRVATQRQLHNIKTLEAVRSRSSLRALQAADRLPYPLSTVLHRGISTWDAIKGRDGTKPEFRVSQIDTELLDEELLGLLNGQVGDALKYFGSHIRDDWPSEILLALRAILFKLSIWDHNASYGASLQNLKYIDARHVGPLKIDPSRWQKIWYGTFSIGGRYAWTKWEGWLAERDGLYDRPTFGVRLLLRLSYLASTAHAAAAFVSFMCFLFNGHYRTLLDRILGLRLAPSRSQLSRQVSFEYLNRQLVWHAFTEFLLFFLPLVGISRWRRWLSRVWRKIKSSVSDSGADDELEKRGELAFLPERTCAICYRDQNPTSASEDEVLAFSSSSGGVIGSAQTDIINPYEAVPCRCVYCFVCIATKLDAEEGDGWRCLRCRELIQECKPWAGDVVEEALSSQIKKTVSFSDGEESDMKKQ